MASRSRRTAVWDGGRHRPAQLPRYRPLPATLRKALEIAQHTGAVITVQAGEFRGCVTADELAALEVAGLAAHRAEVQGLRQSFARKPARNAAWRECLAQVLVRRMNGESFAAALEAGRLFGVTPREVERRVQVELRAARRRLAGRRMLNRRRREADEHLVRWLARSRGRPTR